MSSVNNNLNPNPLDEQIKFLKYQRELKIHRLVQDDVLKGCDQDKISKYIAEKSQKINEEHDKKLKNLLANTVKSQSSKFSHPKHFSEAPPAP